MAAAAGVAAAAGSASASAQASKASGAAAAGAPRDSAGGREASELIVDGVATQRDEGSVDPGQTPCVSGAESTAAGSAAGQHDLGVATGFTGKFSIKNIFLGLIAPMHHKTLVT